MITFPNAKINLGLNIVAKRPDGYHNLETVFYPIPLYDALEIVSAKKNSFTQTGIAVDGDAANNLVMRAYHLLKKDFSLPELDVYLQKNIPFGAGLGGGSADAAFMLKMLNELGDLKLSNEDLEQYGAQLGADVPFFIQNQPVFAEGIGNEFSPMQFSLEGYSLVLEKPDIHVSTKDAYAQVQPQVPHKSIREILASPIETWATDLVNDFERSVFAKFPKIGKIKQKMYDQGAVYASMSGSGSSVFGIFQTLDSNNPEWEKDYCFRFVL
ncbi:4-diphosphocytidyl-2-C-methyl-D-erythritol kinase [Bacteroidia bacterium]|nr:4-diphosphocytidyl-2-C-methyl-D-erythritol kinase [Bacteroidia bacterium]